MRIKNLLSFLLLSCCLFLGGTLRAETFTVLTTTDGLPGSLRDAVINAESGDTVAFNLITNGAFQLLTDGTITIDKSLTIIGNGPLLTIVSGNNLFQILSITPGNTVTIEGIALLQGAATVSGGAIFNDGSTLNLNNVVINGCSAAGDAANEGGGAIANNGGMLNLENCQLTVNTASGASGSGGGILNLDGGSVIVSNSTITNNNASRAGGGIEDNSGTDGIIELDNVNLDENQTGASPGNGGGLHITGPGNANISGGTVNGNTASAEGGGLWNGAGLLMVDGTAITNNTASGDSPDNGGGGIFNLSGIVDITGETIITGNSANGDAGSGGGILNDVGGVLTINGGTISGNSCSRAGGGIEDNSGADGQVFLVGVNLSNNQAGSSPGNGGGLHVTGAGNVEIAGGTIAGNTASAEGGGLWNGAGTMTVTGALISGNTASGDESDQGGGGIFNLSGTLNISGETMITNNTADGAAGSGGGILNDSTATLIVTDATISGNVSNRAGGGIEDNSGIEGFVSLNNVTLDGNTTNTSPGNGGGLHITGSGNIDIVGGTVNGNNAGSEGGGLWNGSGIMNVDGVTIDGNTVSGDEATNGGGGIFNLSGTVNVVGQTTITNNTADGAAGSGGGIFNDTGATLNVENTTIFGNVSNRAGGGIEDNSGAEGGVNITAAVIQENTTNTSPGNGGGIHITGPGDISIMSSLISNNSAGSEGGGLWNGGGLMTVDSCQIAFNTASGDDATNGGGGIFNLSGTVNVTRSVINNNTADGEAGSGGGVFNDTGATLSISNSSINANTSNRAGGGIEDNSGTEGGVTLTGIALDNNTTNTSPGNGGGLHVTGPGDVSFTGGTVANNTAGSEGGGLWNGGGTMTLVGLIIDGNTASGNDADNGGGGVFNLSGTVDISGGTTITNNSADGNSGSGGGIFNDTGATLQMNNVSISGNTSSRAGGGIEDNAGAEGSVSMTDVLLTGNTTGNAPGNGGGLHVTGAGNVDITGGLVANNTAFAEGGGLWNGSGTMTISEVSINNNTATGADATQGGGGVFNAGGTVEIEASTIFDNEVDGAGIGGGIHNSIDGFVNITYSTVSGNESATIGGGVASYDTLGFLAATIAFNVAEEGGGVFLADDAIAFFNSTMVALSTNNNGDSINDLAGEGGFTSIGANLIGMDTDEVFPLIANDILNVDPNLDILADNGGPTMTHAIICPSPAYNSGNMSNMAADQRGEAVFGGQRDIGAFELQIECISSVATIPALEGSKLYPNPAYGGEIFLEMPASFGNDVNMRITSISTGQVLQERNIASGTTGISIGDVPAGMYQVLLYAKGGVASHKLVISK